MTDVEGNFRVGNYQNFRITDNITYPFDYDSYSSDSNFYVGDSLQYHKGVGFSTHDVDNDDNSLTSCAFVLQSAGW